MKVTPELLRRYSRGECTEAEIQMVERWLASTDDDATLSEEEIGNSPERIQDKLFPALFRTEDRPKGKAPVVPLYKIVMRYAAAACLAIGIFFAGHLSGRQSVSYATEIKQGKQLTDVLYIYGGDGTYGQVDGSKYRLRFEGTLRLHNTAQASKQIVCGEQEFTVEPHRTYFLSGSDQDAQFTEEMNLPDAYDVFERLDGTFSIKGIYD